MQTKKIISIALTAALVSSVAAVAAVSSVSAAEEAPTYGLVGSMTGWGEQSDAAMSDVDGDGVYVGVLKNVPAGEQQFKVRLFNDADWTLSWGVYEAENDRTQNSQTNLNVTLAEESDIIVTFDTTAIDPEAAANPDSEVNVDGFDFEQDGFDYWPVRYQVVTASEEAEYGVVGSMTGWGEQSDAAMSDSDSDGVYVGVLKNVPAGEQQFKVRLFNDADWTLSWGVYEAENDRTQNSQTNLDVSLAEAADIVVTLDTTVVDPAAAANPDSEVNVDGFDFEQDGFDYWPVSYQVITASTEDVPTDPSTDESSTDEPSADEPSADEPSADEPSADEPSEPSLGDNYETQISDYIFYDNSETKWENVYAHWWNDDYTKIVDLEGNLWPSQPLDENGNQDFGNAWPGTKMTKIEGTDIWQARVPFGATKIIFNNGKRDDEVNKDAIPDEQVAALANGEITIENMLAANVGVQTSDLPFDSKLNAGQVYKIDTAVAPTSAKGNYKNRKWTFGAGAWDAYTGLYTSELLNEVTVSGDPSVEPTESSDEPTEPSGTNPGGSAGTPGGSTGTTPGGSTGTTPGGTGTGTAPQTGDATVPAVFAVIAVAALGVVLVAAKKKERA